MMRWWFVWSCLIVLLASCSCVESRASARFATFNLSFYRATSGQLVADLVGGELPAGRAHAEILQRVRPDVVLLNEFDYDAEGRAIDAFQREYLAVGQHGQAAIHYPYRFFAPVNTGEPSGHDLDNDGRADGPGDGFGFGRHPGNYGMVVLSRFPILTDQVRTFRKFLWRDMPGAKIPVGWFDRAELDVVRLSSKSHQDVPIDLSVHGVVHFLVSHPTPPVFDGPEDRNGRRNFDEIRLWADYVVRERAGYLRDDAGAAGGLAGDAAFVIAGDLNSDSADGDSTASIAQLLGHARIRSQPVPRSEGAVEAAALQGGANAAHVGDAATDTGQFPSAGPGNLRLDYVLPSREFEIVGTGVFWPRSSDPLHGLVQHTDHRLVWVDVRRASRSVSD